MNNKPPARIVIGNFSDLKHKINKCPPNIFDAALAVPSVQNLLIVALCSLHYY